MTKHFKIKDIPLDDIVIGKEQLHNQISGEDIKALASSISKTGILKPIFVCPLGERGKYVLLTGERYYLAHKKLNRKTIKAIITRKLSEIEAREVQLAESIQRELSIEEKKPQ